MDINKQIRTKSEFNPFNDKFDDEKVQEFVKKFMQKEDHSYQDVEQLSTALSLSQLHIFYLELYDVLKKRVLGSGTDTDELCGRMIALANRHYQLARQIGRDSLGDAERRFEDNFKQKVQSADPSVGMIETSAALETDVDSLNVSLSYIRFFSGKVAIDDNREEISYVIDCSSIAKWSSVLFVVKHCFDDCTWNDGHVYFNSKKRLIQMKFRDPEKLLLNKAGFYRLLRNGNGVFQMLRQYVQKTKASGSAPMFFGETKKQLRIGETSVTNGYINYSIVPGFDERELHYETYNFASVQTYYNFIGNVELPNLPSLSLEDLIGLFSLVQHLVRKASEDCPETSVFQRSDFQKFPFRIKARVLKKYLLERSTNDEQQIDAVIELFTNKEKGRINFWNHPLLRLGEDFMFPLITLIDPNIPYLMDRWLEEGGQDLDIRGKFFEGYLKKRIGEILQKKGYFQHFPKSQKLFNKDKTKYEEIDFFLVLKDIVVMAEVKCVKFPMEPRDQHNGLNRLIAGSEQVNRKAAFVVRHATEMVNQIGDIKGKQIVKLVITNYPLYSGYTLNGVPVVDYFLLESYMSSGVITGQKITESESGITIEETSRIIMQSSEDELGANFSENMRNPLSVSEALKLVELTNNKITLEGMLVQVFVQSAQYKA